MVKKVGFVDCDYSPTGVMYRFEFDKVYNATAFMEFNDPVATVLHVADDGNHWFVDAWCSEDYAELIVDDFEWMFTPSEHEFVYAE